jgi:LmbE family N-acetylglucosaminyl deacetylase
MDDAALSVGGRLLLQRGTRPITILSVVGPSNFVNPRGPADDFDVARVTTCRRAESARVARDLGASHESLDEVDSVLRFLGAPEWSAERFGRLMMAWQSWATFPLVEADVTSLASRLSEAFERIRPDEVWVPLGVGTHPDHVRTRLAFLELIVREPGRFDSICVSFYEDIPYILNFPHHPDTLCSEFNGSGATLRPASEDIAAVFEDKLRLVSTYASQLRISEWGPHLRSAARKAAGTGSTLAERFYVLEARPRSALPSQLSQHAHASSLRLLRQDLARWLGDDPPRMLSVVCPGPVGDFARGKRMLRAAFPDTRIRMFYNDAFRWEMEDETDVERIPLDFRGPAFVTLAREAAHARRPATLFLLPLVYARGARRAQNPLLRAAARLFVRRPRIIARTLGDVCHAITDIGGGGTRCAYGAGRLIAGDAS